MNRGRYIVLLVLAFAAGGVGVWALTRGEDDPRVATQPTTDPRSPESPVKPVRIGAKNSNEGPFGATRHSAWRATRDYITAIDGRDGEWLCRRVNGIAKLDLPVRREGCAKSVSESIGYRDPRGYPVFEKAVTAGRADVKVNGVRARATATVVSEFEDRDEASVEDDVVYLIRLRGRWQIAKPSSTLYRAIGTPDVPPAVLEPPG